MRKLYALVAGLLFVLVATKTNSQPNINPQDLFFEATSITSIGIIDESANDATSSGDTCRANFEVSNAASSPLTKKFTAIPWHSEQKRPVYICWKFGDGTDTCIQYSNTDPGPYTVIHHYQQPGNYEVCLKIVYAGGCEAGKCKAVIVGEFCRADFEKLVLSPHPNPLYVTFKALPWHSENKKPKKICWTFGDGRDTCIEYASNYTGSYYVRHKYREPGSYQVCVKIFYYGGCEAATCKPVQVGRRDECKADFVKLALPTTNNPLNAVFKALPWHSNNKKPKTICWKFGDGKDTCIAYPENYLGNYLVHHIYREAGNYEVCVKITYYQGCEAYKCKRIQIGEPDRCGADFHRTPLANSDNPLVVGFIAIPSHNNNKVPKVICWTFGDGRDTCIEYAQNFSGPYGVRHRYNVPGTYTVCVKILYYGGCEAGKCKPIVATRPDQCRADFEKLPISLSDHSLTVTYKALPWHIENKKPKEICWKFGDGRDTCIQYGEDYAGPYVVHHKYDRPGIYEVCVKIIYDGGCEAKKCEVVNVEAPGECHVKLSELTPSITSLVRGFFASPWSSENKRPVRVCWYFGDGTDTCIQLNSDTSLWQLVIRHTYPAPGVYRACVKILFEGGCVASDCNEVVIRPTANVCGGYMTDSLISPRTFKFKGFAIHNADDPVIAYRWTFGDGSAATGREVTHQYNAPGTYEVCLTIKTQRGCETRICKPLHVPVHTQVALQITPNPVINTMHVLFNSTHNDQVVIKVVNNNGVVLRTWTRNAIQGNNNWDFDVSTLPAGAYTLHIQSTNQLSSQLFIKAN